MAAAAAAAAALHPWLSVLLCERERGIAQILKSIFQRAERGITSERRAERDVFQIIFLRSSSNVIQNTLTGVGLYKYIY